MDHFILFVTSIGKVNTVSSVPLAERIKYRDFMVFDMIVPTIQQEYKNRDMKNKYIVIKER